MPNYLKSLHSILFRENPIRFFKRKLNISYLDNRKLFTIHYNNKRPGST